MTVEPSVGLLGTTRISVHELLKGTLYLPAQEFRETSSPTLHTGPGRLQVAGERGSTVVGGSEASKRLRAGVRPGVLCGSIVCRADSFLQTL